MPLDCLQDLSIARVDHVYVAQSRSCDKAVQVEFGPEELAKATELSDLHSEPLREVRHVIYIDLAVYACRASDRLSRRDRNRLTRVLVSANHAVDLSSHVL